MIMKRLRVLHTISDLHVGGAARLMLRNASNMDPSRFESVICSLGPRDDLVPEFLAAGFTPICLHHSGKLSSGRTLARLLRLLRRERIDLIHTNLKLDSLYGRLAGALFGVPVISTLHATLDPADGSDAGVVTRIARSLEHALTHEYVAVSQAVRDSHVAAQRTPGDSITVIRTGIPLERFAVPVRDEDLERVRRELGLADAYPVLINVGRLHPQKGQEVLIPMMSEVRQRWPKAKLLIVGQGNLFERLTTEVRRSGLEGKVLLTGQRSDVRELLAASHVFVFPSVFGEGMPLAVLEAMACGKPVVAANTAPLAELVRDGACGHLVEVGSGKALAEGVLRLLDTPDAVAAYGNRSREIIQSGFDSARSVKELENLYLEVLCRKGMLGAPQLSAPRAT